MTHTGGVAMRRDHEPAHCPEVHPLDAAQLRIISDGIAVVARRRGEGQVRARAVGSSKRGVVFLPMHWATCLPAIAGSAQEGAAPWQRSAPTLAPAPPAAAAVRQCRH
jgi:hypothetical protein